MACSSVNFTFTFTITELKRGPLKIGGSDGGEWGVFVLRTGSNQSPLIFKLAAS